MSLSDGDGQIARDGLILPFAEPPKPGATIEVAPGLHWARMPLPLRLDHVNVWLAKGSDGWTLVDAGVDRADNRNAWEQIAAQRLCDAPVLRHVATHGHPDHTGLSGWLTERFDCPFHATRAGWLWGRLTRETAAQPPSAAALRFLRANGLDEARVLGFGKEKSVTARLVGPQPGAFVQISERVPVVIGDHPWQPIIADGHADEHASFWNAEQAILIAGDQILQRISPVIGVFPGEPEADPLGDYLASLDRFEALPGDPLVLPSHGLPFRGLKTRIAALRRHHDERLADAQEACRDRWSTGMEVTARLFPRAVAEGQWFLGLAESLAHLHRLYAMGRLERSVDAERVIRFHDARLTTFVNGP